MLTLSTAMPKDPITQFQIYSLVVQISLSAVITKSHKNVILSSLMLYVGE